MRCHGASPQRSTAFGISARFSGLLDRLQRGNASNRICGRSPSYPGRRTAAAAIVDLTAVEMLNRVVDETGGDSLDYDKEHARLTVSIINFPLVASSVLRTKAAML